MANVPTPCPSSVDAAAAVAREAFCQAAPDLLSQSADRDVHAIEDTVDLALSGQDDDA